MATDYRNPLPPKLREGQAKLGRLFATAYLLQSRILAAYATYRTLTDILTALIALLNQLLAAINRWIVEWVPLFTIYYVRKAEQAADIPSRPLSIPELDDINAEFAKPYHAEIEQMKHTLTEEVTDAWGDAKKMEQLTPVGMKRDDGSILKLDSTGQALSRTTIVQLENERYVARWREAGISHIRFVVGTACRFYPVTCEMLDGQVVPIDDIPPGWLPPRHLYGNSHVEPVLAGDR